MRLLWTITCVERKGGYGYVAISIPTDRDRRGFQRLRVRGTTYVYGIAVTVLAAVTFFAILRKSPPSS